MSTIDWTALAAPFPEDVVKWRAGSTTRDGKRSTLLAYIDARIVMDRLDDVAGPANWRVSYAPAPAGGVMSCLEVRVDGEWIGKCDASDNTDIEATKGGVSGALKRAAVCWGIGRYLYDLDASWHPVLEGWANGKGVDISKAGQHIGWVPTPTLPEWARPKAPPLTDETHDLIRRQFNRLKAPPSGWDAAARACFVRMGQTPPARGIADYTEAQGAALAAFLKTQKPKNPAVIVEEVEDGDTDA